MAQECLGPRKADFRDFHTRVGLDAERWYLQSTPQGDQVVLYLEGDPLGAIGKLAASDAPFDVWFRDSAKAVHGIDFAQPLPGPPPEMIFEA